MQNKLKFKIAIPARYQSTRLPGKPLLDIAGKPMIQWVYEKAMQCGADEVVVATDDMRIADICNGFGARVCITDPNHQSGTDRLAELATICGWDKDDIVVNLQGDEPLIPTALLLQVASNLTKNTDSSIATLYTPIHEREEVVDPNVVKVVKNNSGEALYFSRAPIPWDRDKVISDSEIANYYYRHLGIYAYRVDFLLSYSSLDSSYIEKYESLEQLRALSNGYKIHIEEAVELPGMGVDTAEDLEKVKGKLVN